MTICSNPKKTRIRVPVGESTVILILGDISGGAYQKFLDSRFKVKRKGKVEDHSNEARIEFINETLIGIEGENASKKKEKITFIDPLDKKEKELTTSVKNWVGYVNPSWKISAAMALEEGNAEIEDHAVKN